MKKWMNTLFFGSCFIASVLIDGYAIQVFNGDLITAVGLGIVVLITGYLFVDSARSGLKKSQEETKSYIEKIVNEETEKLNERYTELINLQKASYSATKKNTDMAVKKFEEVLFKIEILEDINSKAQQKIIDLQKGLMQGQKKALNLEVNYSKENTKQIIDTIKSGNDITKIEDQLSDIISRIDHNALVMTEGFNRIEELENKISLLRQSEIRTDDNNELFKSVANDLKNGFDINNDNGLFSNINSDQTIATDGKMEEGFIDNSYNDNYILTENSYNNMDNSLDDINSEKNMLFMEDTAEYTNDVSFPVDYNDTYSSDESMDDNYDDFIDYTAINNNETNEDYIDYTVNINNVSNEDLIHQDMWQNKNASESEGSNSEEPESEAYNLINDEEEIETPKVVPIYDDPNKALTADEIAALFASFGQ